MAPKACRRMKSLSSSVRILGWPRPRTRRSISWQATRAARSLNLPTSASGRRLASPRTSWFRRVEPRGLSDVAVVDDLRVSLTLDGLPGRRRNAHDVRAIAQERLRRAAPRIRSSSRSPGASAGRQDPLCNVLTAALASAPSGEPGRGRRNGATFSAPSAASSASSNFTSYRAASSGGMGRPLRLAAGRTTCSRRYR